MENLKIVVNENLKTVIVGTGDVQLIDLTIDNLKVIGFLDENGWPTEKMLKVIADIDKFSPSDFKNGVKLWDQLPRGFSVFNHFIEDGYNPE